MEKKQGVYIILNLKENRKYVGSTKHIYNRIAYHKQVLNKGTHHNESLQMDWDRLGEDMFIFKVLEEIVDDIKLRERERYYIELFREGGIYNLSIPDDGIGTLSHAQETKDKLKEIDEYRRTNNPEEYKDRIERAKITRKLWVDNNPEKVKEITEAFKKAGQEASMKKAKTIIVYNEEVCHIFISARQAAAELGFNYNRVHEAIKGKRAVTKGVYKEVKSHKGFKFNYLEDLKKIENPITSPEFTKFG